MADWIALFRAAKHLRLVDPIDNRDITDNRSALPEATALPEPREGAAANVDPVDNSDSTDNRVPLRALLSLTSLLSTNRSYSGRPSRPR
jgi:hypothetical protein